MDERSLELLELPAIRERVAGATSFGAGQALAERMQPSGDPAEVRRRAKETEEALALREAGVAGPRGARDLRDRLPAASRGGLLEPDELYDIAQTLEVALDLRERILPLREIAPGLGQLISDLEVGALSALSSELARAIGPGGEVLDTASPELGGLRRRLAAARANAERLVGDLARRNAEHLQESFTTTRGGRPVLAVKASARKAVPGLVHDRSASGETIFVEPLELVEQNNLASELLAEERAEIERILKVLSGRVGALAQQLERTTDALATLDFALARADISQRWSGSVVTIGERIEVAQARHPLLDAETAVPIDVGFSDLSALIVSGPNTGGKTVALKTLGLAALLHQCGLRVPAKKVELPVFDTVLADIGDEQSIARSLSTFSGHVARLRQIVDVATGRSLVLLDEVASGTDPVEGSALARAVLESLVELGARVVATTHHAEVKEWAAEHDGVANAAVGVDPKTLEPTYEFRVGEPGASHALTVADRLGLPGAIVERARALVSPTRRETERLLEDAESARVEAKEELARAVSERKQAEDVTRKAEERAKDLEERIAKNRRAAEAERQAARREVEQELSAASAALGALRKEISAARKQEGKRKADRGTTHEAERDRRLGEADAAAAAARAALAAAEQTGQAAPVAVGDRVVDSALGMRGTIAAIEGDTAVLNAQRGGRMRIPLARLAPDRSPAPAAPAPPPASHRAAD